MASHRIPAALSTVYPEARQMLDPEVRKLQIMRLIGKMPTVAAYTYRRIATLVAADSRP